MRLNGPLLVIAGIIVVMLTGLGVTIYMSVTHDQAGGWMGDELSPSGGPR